MTDPGRPCGSVRPVEDRRREKCQRSEMESGRDSSKTQECLIREGSYGLIRCR